MSMNILKTICPRHKVTVLSFSDGTRPIQLEDFKRETGASFVHLTNHCISRSIVNLLRSYIYNVPLTVFRNRSKNFGALVESMFSAFDAIFVDHYVMFQYVPRDFEGIVILHEHNVEHVLWRRYANVEQNVFKKCAAYIESYRIKRYESRSCQLSDHIFCLSNNDVEGLNKFSQGLTRVSVLPPVGNVQLLDSPPLKFEDTEPIILFVGTLTWEANRDGLEWFLDKVWPLIIERLPSVSFSIIGNCRDKIFLNKLYALKRVVYEGFVDDLSEYYNKSRVLVSPNRFGSGVKIKILDAMYRGVPVATTTVGIEGVDAYDMNNVVVADDHRELAGKIIMLLSDKKIWTKISKNSRSLVYSQYRRENIKDSLVKILPWN